MGSGRGKTRRTQAKEIKGATVNDNRWKEFVESNQLEKVGVYRYYLKRETIGQFTRGDHQRVIQEIFEDAVAVGAIQLTSPYTTEDFEFKLGPNPEPWDKRVHVTTKGKDLTKLGELRTPVYALDAFEKMGGREITFTLLQIASAINSLLLVSKP